MVSIDKSLMHGSQLVMRCSLQIVYQWTEELSIRTNGVNCKASLTNSDFSPMVPLVTIGICLCILDTCGGSFEEKFILFTIPGVSCIIDDFLGNVLHFLKSLKEDRTRH